MPASATSRSPRAALSSTIPAQRPRVENAGTAFNDGTIASLTNTGGTFSNSGTITGDATVTGGTLVNDGTIGGTLLIYTGGLLTGSGYVGTLTVASGGTLSPGSGYATVTVNGDLTFQTGSTYQVETDASGASGSVAATGAVTIENGSTLSILAGSGTYGLSTSYTILTGSSITGEFDTVTSDLAFLSPILTYDPTGVTLGLYRNDVNFADVATTANGRATANAVQALGTDNTLFLGVLPLSASGARDAFAELSGESHVSMKSLLIENSSLLRDAILDRFSGTGDTMVKGAAAGQGKTAADDGPSFWMAGLGATTHISGDGNAPASMVEPAASSSAPIMRPSAAGISAAPSATAIRAPAARRMPIATTQHFTPRTAGARSPSPAALSIRRTRSRRTATSPSAPSPTG